MNNETLLNIAERNYRQALKGITYFTGDEGELNLIGYFLQQAAELCIKHCMEINGIRYAHTHAIEDLLDDCENSCYFSEEFYNFSPAITKMEAKTRYIKNYRLATQQVKTAFRLVKQLLLDNGSTEESLTLPAARYLESFDE